MQKFRFYDVVSQIRLLQFQTLLYVIRKVIYAYFIKFWQIFEILFELKMGDNKEHF